MQQHWLSHGGPRSPALRGVRGRADRKGGCCEAQGAASGDARTEGLGGRGLRSGAGSAESRDQGEGAASQGAGATGSASSGREGDAAGRDSNSRERALLGEAEVKKGFKQDNVARGGVYAHRGPKPPQQHLKPKRKDNWAAKAAAAFIRGRAPGARVFRSLAIPTP